MMAAASTDCRMRGAGSGGMIDTSCVSNGLEETNCPRTGMANPPIWLNRLSGGPLTRRIDRLIGSSVFQSANVFRVVIKVVPGGEIQMVGLAGRGRRGIRR